MQYQIGILSLLAVVGLAQASALMARANGKANEFPTGNCTDSHGGTKSSWEHKPLCGCITMDPSTGSVYLAKGPSQRITAFANSACNPGKDNADVLGSVGGPCVDTTNRFDTGIIQSVLFDVPVICTIGKLVSGLPEEAADALGAAIEAGLI